MGNPHILFSFQCCKKCTTFDVDLDGVFVEMLEAPAVSLSISPLPPLAKLASCGLMAVALLMRRRSQRR